MPVKRVCCICGGTCFSRLQPFTCRKCKKLTDEELKERRTSVSRKYNHGIDDLEFEALWIAFKGRCGICGTSLSDTIKGRGQPLSAVVIDHNHETGNIRGLLCNACNKGIGLLKDNPEIIHNAWRWVKND